jgi:hypothetical protein
MPLEKLFDEQIVFKQAAPATPVQFAEGSFAKRLLAVQAVQRRVTN